MLKSVLAALLSYAVSGPYVPSSGGGGTFTGGTLSAPLVEAKVVIAADDVTPDVSGGNYFVTSANTGATAITDLDLPAVNQVVEICGGSDTNPSTIADSGNFNLEGAITLAADTCIRLRVQADNDYVEVSRRGSANGVNVQTFTAAGAHTWRKPAAASFCAVYVFAAGGGGGSGGATTSDSGGGGGGGGAQTSENYPASLLPDSVSVTVGAGGAGGAGVAAGNGNAGGDGASTSFGTLLNLDPHAGQGGGGGDTGSGAVGSASMASYTTKLIGGIANAANNAGAGDDAAAGANATVQSNSVNPFFLTYLATGGAGGGGTNGGANKTNGGSIPQVLDSLSAATLLATINGATSDGGSGTAGTAGGFGVATLTGQYITISGGRGGSGGAGAIGASVDGGAGAAGGTCGGGGAGGGASLLGLSGAGGAGGAGCVVAVCW